MADCYGYCNNVVNTKKVDSYRYNGTQITTRMADGYCCAHNLATVHAYTFVSTYTCIQHVLSAHPYGICIELQI